MRIGFVAPGDLSTPTGGYVYDRHVVEALRQRHEVEVVTVPPSPSGVTDAACLVRRSRRRGFDVVVQDGLCASNLIPFNPLIAAPVVGIVHLLAGDDLRKGMVSKALQRTYLHSIESCVYTSVATRKSSRSNVDSVVAHPASRFSPEVTEQEVRSEAQQDGLSVAFVGDISPVKGLDRLVKAVSRVPGCRLTVAGRTSDPRYAGRVKRLCSSLRVSDRVEFAGVLEADEVASLFSRSDVVAVPSDHESFGTAYLEGMSFGLPAVASPSGGACELIEHGRNGFLERDEIGVSDALSTLAENPDTLSRMSVEALRTERDWQDWKETTRKVVEHVERTAKG